MLAFEEYAPQQAHRLPDRHPGSLRRVAGGVLHVAETVLDYIALAIAPAAPPDSTSEHFGHAEKRIDPRPDVNPLG